MKIILFIRVRSKSSAEQSDPVDFTTLSRLEIFYKNSSNNVEISKRNVDFDD